MIPIVLVASESEIARSYIANYLQENRINPERVFEVAPLKKEIVLSQVKDVLKRIMFASEMPRLFIFHGFDTAASESQNALLKSLEESSVKNQFILVVKNEHLLFPTIRSRSRIIRLNNQKPSATAGQNRLQLLKEVESSSNYHFLVENTLKNADREQLVQIFDELLLAYQKRLASEPLAVIIIKKIFSLRTLLLANNLSPQQAYDNLLIFISKAFRMKI